MKNKHLWLIGAASFFVMLAGCQTAPLVNHASRPALPKINEFPDVYAFYPAKAAYMHETGTAIVRVCVGRDGKLTAAPRIVRSTGFPRLDRAALAYVRATSGDWLPALRRGVPVVDCHGIPIRFEIPRQRR